VFGVAYVTTTDVKTESFWLMPATPKYKETGIPYITSKNIKDGKISFDDVKYISMEDYSEISANRSVQKDDLLITMIGTIGEAAFVEENTIFYGQNIYLVRLDENIVNRKFYYYFLTSSNIREKLISKKNASSQGYIKAGSIDDLVIPLPTLEEQTRIVEVLDKFYTLSTDLDNGLPAEIDARQKQYEYYRDKLLSFNDANG
jgi:type I restriction enzyme S subunit